MRAVDNKRYPERGLVAIIQRLHRHEEERELEAYLYPDDTAEPKRRRAHPVWKSNSELGRQRRSRNVASTAWDA